MASSYILYFISIIVAAVIWYGLRTAQRGSSAAAAIILLFVLDISLTIEAAVLFSDAIFIAVLHMITIPILCVLVYYDLVQQNKKKFTCYICKKSIDKADNKIENIEIVTKNGNTEQFTVHTECANKLGKTTKDLDSRVMHA